MKVLKLRHEILGSMKFDKNLLRFALIYIAMIFSLLVATARAESRSEMLLTAQESNRSMRNMARSRFGPPGEQRGWSWLARGSLWRIF